MLRLGLSSNCPLAVAEIHVATLPPLVVAEIVDSSDMRFDRDYWVRWSRIMINLVY